MTLTTMPSGRSSATYTCMDIHGPALRCFGTAAAPASTTWPTANMAFFIPFYVEMPEQILEIFWVSGTTPGTTNFDLGIYRDDGTRVVSLGATAAVSTTDIIQPAGGGDIADAVLMRGRYYMAMSSAATTLTVRALSQAVGLFRAIGMRQMASAHPLPATATFASIGTTNFMPIMGLTTVTNIL